MKFKIPVNGDKIAVVLKHVYILAALWMGYTFLHDWLDFDEALFNVEKAQAIAIIKLTKTGDT